MIPVYTRPTPLRVTFLNLFLMALLLTMLPNPGYSQGASATDGSTPSGLAPGAPAGSYALSDLESVNLFNGNLNVALPLLGVGGRGSAVMKMTLSLNSKRWRVLDLSNPEYYESYVPDPDWWTGLKPGYGLGVLQGRWGGVALQNCSYLDPFDPPQTYI